MGPFLWIMCGIKYSIFCKNYKWTSIRGQKVVGKYLTCYEYCRQITHCLWIGCVIIIAIFQWYNYYWYMLFEVRISLVSDGETIIMNLILWIYMYMNIAQVLNKNNFEIDLHVFVVLISTWSCMCYGQLKCHVLLLLNWYI